MYMCVKYRCKCHGRHFPTITAAYEIHGPSTRQSDPKRELQQKCISKVSYNIIFPGIEPRSATCYSTTLTIVPLITHGKFTVITFTFSHLADTFAQSDV